MDTGDKNCWQHRITTPTTTMPMFLVSSSEWTFLAVLVWKFFYHQQLLADSCWICYIMEVSTVNTQMQIFLFLLVFFLGQPYFFLLRLSTAIVRSCRMWKSWTVLLLTKPHRILVHYPYWCYLCSNPTVGGDYLPVFQFKQHSAFQVRPVGLGIPYWVISPELGSFNVPVSATHQLIG